MVMTACWLVVTTIAHVHATGPSASLDNATGWLFNWRTLFTASPIAVAAIHLVCSLLIGGLLWLLNKVYGFVRTATYLPVSAYWLLQSTATVLPSDDGAIGSCLALVTIATLFMLFDASQESASPRRRRILFLVFFVASAGSLLHHATLLLIIAIVVGTMCMHVIDLKGLVAMLLGLVTPWWIVLGLGLASPANLQLPQLGAMGIHYCLRLPPTIIDSIVVGIVATIAVAGDTFKLRWSTRICNILLSLFTMVLAVGMLVATHYATAWVASLNLLVAAQVTRWYVLSQLALRHYVLILFVLVCIILSLVS